MVCTNAFFKFLFQFDMYIASFFMFGAPLLSEIGASCNLVVHVSENKND